MKTKRLLLCVLLLAAAVGFGARASADDAPEYIPNCVDLYFPSNPTTGYVWTAETEDGEIVEIEDLFFPDSAELGFTGSGGTHWFHLDGLKEGMAGVTFRYARPWENKPPLYEFVYRLSVDEQQNVLIWGVEMSDWNSAPAPGTVPADAGTAGGSSADNR